MSSTDTIFEPLHGSCLCGAITFTATSPPKFAPCVCHCLDCQKVTGSTYSVNVFVPKDSLKIEGPFKIFNDSPATSASPDLFGMAFCGTCSSHFVAFPDSTPTMANIKMGCLDKESKDRLEKPKLEMFIGRKPSWVGVVEGARQCEGFPE